MNNARTYAYIVIGCVVGALAGLAAGGLSIAVGIACGAGVGVALASPATCGPTARGSRRRSDRPGA